MYNPSPKEIYDLLSQHVYGQPMAKRALAVALANRFRMLRIPAKDRAGVRKSNVLLKGPTGTGKSALMRALREGLGLPVFEFDITGFSETGYVGRSVDDIAKELIRAFDTVKVPDWYLKLGEKTEEKSSTETKKFANVEKYAPWFSDIVRYMTVYAPGNESADFKEGMSHDHLINFIQFVKPAMPFLKLLSHRTDYIFSGLPMYNLKEFGVALQAPPDTDYQRVSDVLNDLGFVMYGLEKRLLTPQANWEGVIEAVTKDSNKREKDFLGWNNGLKAFVACYMQYLAVDSVAFLKEFSGGVADKPFLLPPIAKTKPNADAYKMLDMLFHRSILLGIYKFLGRTGIPSNKTSMNVFETKVPGKNYSFKDVLLKAAKQRGQTFEGLEIVRNIFDIGFELVSVWLGDKVGFSCDLENRFRDNFTNIINSKTKSDIRDVERRPHLLASMGFTPTFVFNRVLEKITASNIYGLRVPGGMNKEYGELEIRVRGGIYRPILEHLDPLSESLRKLQEEFGMSFDTAGKMVKPATKDSAEVGKSFVETFAVVFIDEIDKLSGGTTKSGVSREGVQRGLLKMLEGGVYDVPKKNQYGLDNGEVLQVDTTNILFVAAGAFSDPTMQLMPELNGRLPIVAKLERLGKDEFVHILKMDNSSFHGFRKLLEVEDIRVIYDDSTFEYIAEKCQELNDVEDLGARRLDQITESVFSDGLFSPEQFLEKGYDITRKAIEKRSK